MEDYKGSVFSKALGRTDVISIGFGTVVGWSWVILGASWINNAGFLGAILAFLVGGAIALLIGLMYSELTSALPVAGGGFVFAYRAFGPDFAFLAGWILLLAYVGVAAWEGIALATAVDYLIPVPKLIPLWEIAGYQVYLSWALVGVAGALLVTIFNIFGIRTTILFQVMASGTIFIVVLILFFGGITFGSAGNIGELFTGFDGFFFVLIIVPGMLIGFDVIPQSSEELNLEPKSIGHMIIVCIILSVAWYCILIIGTGLSAPPEVRTSGTLPVVDIAAYLFKSDAFGVVVILGGILGIMTTWNGFFIGSTRLFLALGRAGMLPPIFAKSGKRSKSSIAGTLTVGALCMITPFLGQNALIWLVYTSSFCSIISYVILAITFVALRRREAELSRPYSVPHGDLFGFVTLVLVGTYLIMYIFDAYVSNEGYYDFAVIIIWMAVGIVAYCMSSKQRILLRPEEMEYRIFGREYSRIKSDVDSEGMEGGKNE